MTTDSQLIETRLERLYPQRGQELASQIYSLIDEYRSADTGSDVAAELWNEHDVVLITYGDHLRSAEATPLGTLGQWLESTGLDELFSVVHLLPFYPYSSDDGFSVIDYMQVKPEFGDWEDVARLSDRIDLMFDLVLNHISSQSEWFQEYLAGRAPFDKFFVEVDPSTDLSQVVRPRSLPLLTPFETGRGTRHVWTTFSDDQIDLNFAEPEVLLQMLRVLLEYAKRGARIIRLDAVGFLWKTIGTNCMHLPETHEAVKLLRDVITAAFPSSIVLTETNVPHDENVSYFGDGDEAHMVYQFSLPPLLLDAFVNGDAVYLRKWLEDLDPPPPGCTFFNFTASHDGVGVRPLEGLVPEVRFANLVNAMGDRGAFINTRRQTDGTDVPYELNITYVDALSPTKLDEPSDLELQARRFLASQAVMLAMPGVPAIYFNSLVGTQNDYQGVETSGINRRINRHKYELAELTSELQQEGSLAQRIYQGYRQLLAARRHPAFHPEATITLHNGVPDEVLAFTRISRNGTQELLVAVNFGAEAVDLSTTDMMKVPGENQYTDLLTGEQCNSIVIPAGGFLWLEVV